MAISAVMVRDIYGFEHLPTLPSNAESWVCSMGRDGMRIHHVAVATGLMLGMAGCAPNRVALSVPAIKTTPQRPPTPALPAKPAKTAKTAKTTRLANTTRPANTVKAANKAKAAKPVSAAKAAKPGVARRPSRADSLRLETELIKTRSRAPLTDVLARRSGNPEVADRAAAAVVFESLRLRLSPSFLAAVLMVENTPMDPTAESDAGAIGLMQVMPVHSGSFGCPADLQEVEANICHGARLLHMYLRRNKTVQGALRRYNGCVGALVTRSCLRYPARVLRTASRIRREMLAAPIDTTPPPAPPPPPLYLRRAAVPSDSEPSRVEAWPQFSLLLATIDSLGAQLAE
jgi:hypothetical protein